MPRFLIVKQAETAAEAAPTALANGSFEAGLTGWTVDYGTATIVETGGQGDNGKFLRFTAAGRISQRCIIPSTDVSNALLVYIRKPLDTSTFVISIMPDDRFECGPLFDMTAYENWTGRNTGSIYPGPETTGTIYIECSGAFDIDSISWIYSD